MRLTFDNVWAAPRGRPFFIKYCIDVKKHVKVTG